MSVLAEAAMMMNFGLNMTPIGAFNFPVRD
jgi:hypothetical protein